MSLLNYTLYLSLKESHSVDNGESATLVMLVIYLLYNNSSKDRRGAGSSPAGAVRGQKGSSLVEADDLIKLEVLERFKNAMIFVP